jgi:uracil-DNA glycosylase family 4
VTADRSLIARYLRQRAELGERELFLDGLTALEAVTLLSGQPERSEGRQSQRIAAPAQQLAVPSVSPPARAAQPASPQLIVVRQQVESCNACGLHHDGSTVVFGEGNPAAEVVIVGEAPGAEEERTGRPFVGPAGKLLDLLLMTAGFARDSVFICNVLKFRPPGNRDPLPTEVMHCSVHLRAQLDAIRPRVLVTVGNFAARALLGTEAGVTKLRRQIHEYNGIPLIATFHPAFLLRSPQWTRSAWQDFQMIRRVLDEQE